MEIRFKKGFVKAYKKLNPRAQGKVDVAIELFQTDPFHVALRNHELKGNLVGKRAISAAHDLRIIYVEENDHAVVYMLSTGSHNQVY